MHPRDILWESEGCSAPLWHPRWEQGPATDYRLFARVTRHRPDVRDPNSHLRGQQLLYPPTIYRIYEIRLDRLKSFGGASTRRLKGLRDFPHLGPFEFVTILGEYEPHPHATFSLEPTP